MPRGLVIGVVISAKFALLHNGCEIERNDESTFTLYTREIERKALKQAFFGTKGRDIKRDHDALVLVNDFVSRCVCCEYKRVQNSFF